jgi:DNA-binding LacI/PurR family transcriptional regulator
MRPTKKLLQAKLRVMACSRGPDAKLPTRQQLAKDLGACEKTIHDVLADLEAANVIYRRQGSGIYVSPKIFCKKVRVLIDTSLVEGDDTSPFWGLLWAQLVKEGQQRATDKEEEVHYELVARGSELPHVRKAITGGMIDGVLCVGLHEQSTDWLNRQDIPVVSFAGVGDRQIILAGERALADAVRRLAALGCRRIGFWWASGPLSAHWAESTYRESRGLIESNLSANGLAYYPEICRLGLASFAEIENVGVGAALERASEGYLKQGELQALRTFGPSAPPRPDGVVVGLDMLTLGALPALWKLGIQPGVDVAIASHSNVGSPILTGWKDDLLLWSTDPAEIAATMFRALDRLMAGETPDRADMVVHSRFREER